MPVDEPINPFRRARPVPEVFFTPYQPVTYDVIGMHNWATARARSNQADSLSYISSGMALPSSQPFPLLRIMASGYYVDDAGIEHISMEYTPLQPIEWVRLEIDLSVDNATMPAPHDGVDLIPSEPRIMGLTPLVDLDWD